METKRKVVVITRHGKTLNNPETGASLDVLTDETVPSLYDNTGEPLRDYIERPEEAIVLHSDKNRTINTAKAILAGALGYVRPQNGSDLEGLDFEEAHFYEDLRMGFSDIPLNMTAYAEDGHAEFMRRWVAEHDRSDYAGISFNDMIERVKYSIRDVVARDNRQFGIMSTHGGNADALVAAAVNSGRDTPIRSRDEIGGFVDKEGYAVIFHDTRVKSGNTESKLVKEGVEYKIDLGNL